MFDNASAASTISDNLYDYAERELQEEEDRACDDLCIVRMLARKMNEALEKAIPIIIIHFRESHKFNELQKKYDTLLFELTNAQEEFYSYLGKIEGGRNEHFNTLRQSDDPENKTRLEILVDEQKQINQLRWDFNKKYMQIQRYIEWD